MRIHRVSLAVCAAAVTFALPISVHAQGHGAHAAGDQPAVVGSLLRDLAQVERKVVALAEAIPETAYAWRPAEGVRSVSEVLMHIAADNYFLPTFTGLPAPAGTGIKDGDYPSVQAYEGRQVTKAEALQELRDSFAHLRSAFDTADEAALASQLDVFGSTMSGLDLAVLTTTHLHEHLGQMIAYARSNGVVPPWSQGSSSQ